MATRTATQGALDHVAIVVLQEGEVAFSLVLVDARGVFNLLFRTGKVSTQGSDRGCVGLTLRFQASLLVEELAVFRLDLRKTRGGSVADWRAYIIYQSLKSSSHDITCPRLCRLTCSSISIICLASSSA